MVDFNRFDLLTLGSFTPLYRNPEERKFKCKAFNPLQPYK